MPFGPVPPLGGAGFFVGLERGMLPASVFGTALAGTGAA